MDEDMITDITLDHLPDLSEASVSFQIPNNNVSADLLLADHTDGFDLLRDAFDDDVSFTPAALRHPRGPPLTLGELTPRVQPTPPPPPRSRSPTPTEVPSSSAKPFVIQHPLTLGHGSPDKRRKTPLRAKSIHRQLESPFVSEERLDQLRMEVETLSQPDATSSHAQTHTLEPAKDNSVECKSPSRANSRLRNNAPNSPPASADRLDPLPEEKDTEISSDQDVVMDPGDNYPADATNIAVPTPRPKSKRNPRTTAKPTAVVQTGGFSKRPAFPATHVSKKTKSKPPHVREAYQVPPSAVPQLNPPQSIAIDAEEGLVPPACVTGKIDSKSRNTQITQPNTGAMAERLVSYSQKLISSIGLYKPSHENSFIEASKDAVRVADALSRIQPPAAAPPLSPPREYINDIPSARNGPFRLSEISPQKPLPKIPQPSSPAHTGALQDGKQRDMSPMRPAKKRITLDADLPQEYHPRKKGKTMPADASSERGSSDEAVSQAHPRSNKASHADQPFSRSETRHSTRHLDSSKPTLPSARTKYRPKLNPSSQRKGPTLDPFPYLTSARQVHETTTGDKGKCDERHANAANVRSQSSLSGFSASSRQRQQKRTRQGNNIVLSHAWQHSGPASAADLPLIEKKQNATLSVAQLTKPVGFTFRVDARLEARKTEERLAASEPWKTHSLYPVPDLKALRASHQAAFTFHKEGIVPSVPVPVVPFSFCTEQRAKEREKFDEMVRRKEEEMLRLKEEQRRREAEEEERAIKELRRKAIPKANEIPEWYADMPKRKGTAM